MAINFQRFWAMPTADTFDCQPIGDFVKKYLRQSKVSVDPFARNKRWATYTNDLNPNTAAEYHLDALDFLKMLKERGVVADLVVFDPPYSPHQTKECYAGFGHSMKYADDARHGWSKTRKALLEILSSNGIALSFGWDTIGLGNHLEMIEVMLVCHGIGHNDTICMAERKAAEQLTLLDAVPEAAS